MYAGRRRVECQFADGNTHAAGTLVTEPQDPLVVGGDNQTHILMGHVLQDVRDVLDVVRRNPNPTRMPQDVTELLAGAPHGGRIHDR